MIVQKCCNSTSVATVAKNNAHEGSIPSSRTKYLKASNLQKKNPGNSLELQRKVTTKSEKIIDPKVRFPTDDQRVVLALVEFSIQRNKTGNSTKVKNVDVIIPPTTTVARGR